MAECITLENGLRVETFHVEPCTCTNAQLRFEELRKDPEYVKEYEKLSRSDGVVDLVMSLNLDSMTTEIKHSVDCQCMRCDEC